MSDTAKFIIKVNYTHTVDEHGKFSLAWTRHTIPRIFTDKKIADWTAMQYELRRNERFYVVELTEEQLEDIVFLKLS